MGSRDDTFVDGGSFLPKDIVLSSDPLGWNGVRSQLRITRTSGVLEEPVMFENDLVILHSEFATMWQELDGVSEHVWLTQGSIIVIPRGGPVRWWWGTGARAITIGINAHNGSEATNGFLNFEPVQNMHDPFIS